MISIGVEELIAYIVRLVLMFIQFTWLTFKWFNELSCFHKLRWVADIGALYDKIK